MPEFSYREVMRTVVAFAVSVGCGDTTSENCTYCESTGVTAGCCTVEICPCGDHICQVLQCTAK